MRKGFLSQYFEGVAAKRLRAVEANCGRSNQHEFNGVRAFRQLLGDEPLLDHPARHIWLGEESEGVSADSNVSWYDARKGQSHRAAEYRLYFRTNPVMELAGEGDLLIVGKRPAGELILVVAQAGSTVENQLLWLFGVPVQIGTRVKFRDFENGYDTRVDIAARFILDELGIDIEEPEADKLDSLLEHFQGVFPTTMEFSTFARDTLPQIVPSDDPDAVLMAWMEQEEKLFRRMERHIVADRLRNGFLADGVADVDGFIKFSLGVQNRRKSRAGYAFENHLEQIFRAHNIRFDRGTVTENRAKPDFVFPGGAEYRNPDFPATRLSMLGVKSSCKDRWRQVLSEAARIPSKHLLTLEPGISENQTNEMATHQLQLVLPRALHESYRESQRAWLMNVEEFIGLVRTRQN